MERLNPCSVAERLVQAWVGTYVPVRGSMQHATTGVHQLKRLFTFSSIVKLSYTHT